MVCFSQLHPARHLPLLESPEQPQPATSSSNRFGKHPRALDSSQIEQTTPAAAWNDLTRSPDIPPIFI